MPGQLYRGDVEKPHRSKVLCEDQVLLGRQGLASFSRLLFVHGRHDGAGMVDPAASGGSSMDRHGTRYSHAGLIHPRPRYFERRARSRDQ